METGPLISAGCHAILRHEAYLGEAFDDACYSFASQPTRPYESVTCFIRYVAWKSI